MTIDYERRDQRKAIRISIPLLTLIVIGAAALAAVGAYEVKPSQVVSTTTQTVQIVSTQLVTVTSTSVVTTSPPYPTLIRVYGTVSTSTYATSPTKLQIEDSASHVLQSIDLTTTTSHSYNTTLANGEVYYFHVFWNISPIGAGDKICATLQLTAGPGTSSIRLDLNC